jgi:hypothetical protein
MEEMKRTKGKSLADVRRQQASRQKFKQLYNEIKTVKFSNDVNMVKYFNFPKFIGKTGSVKIDKIVLAVYPALCSTADFKDNKWFQISRDNIAKLAGLTPPTVDKAINHLINGKYRIMNDGKTTLLLERKMKTEGKRHFYMYRVGFIRDMEKWHGFYFVFHTCIVTSGIWAELTPRAKALYLAMRTYAKFDRELYIGVELDGVEPWEADFDFRGEAYRERKWDYCDTPLTELCRSVNIESTNIRSVIEQLEEYHLISEEELMNVYRVYLKPNNQ